MFKKFIKYLTRWAWVEESSYKESIAKLKKLSLDPTGLEMEIKLNPELKKYIAQCFAEIVHDCPNYTEMKFDIVAKKNDGAEWITVLVKKGSGKTPHELRMEAEEKLRKMQNTLTV